MSALERHEVRRVITDAYYNTRNEGGTMEQAADRAADAVMALWLEDRPDHPDHPAKQPRRDEHFVEHLDTGDEAVPLAGPAPLVDGVPPPWVAKDTGRCRSCHAQVIWAEHPETGKRSPFDADGTGISHFATCPQAAYWRGGRRGS